jgi:glycosyltransferase involved in cell wall biosynthesis
VLVVSKASLATVPPDVLGAAAVCLVTEDSDGASRLESLRAAVAAIGVEPEFLGWARASNGPDVAVGLVRSSASRGTSLPPDDFRVLAIIPTFNEADVIVPSVGALLDQGVAVHVVDNWSTDGTVDLVTAAFGERVTVERFPKDGPTDLYQWDEQLARISEVARSAECNWVISHDADERRHGPWRGLDLRAALYRVEAEGYNAVDHTVVDFPPIDDGFAPGSDYERYFTHFEPTEVVANRIQIKAWKTRDGVELISGGHEAMFPGRRVHPFNFLLKHYPIRSQAHGERKVFAERKPRILDEERGRHHTHYDHVRSGHEFLRDPEALMAADGDFAERWLLERLYGFPSRRTSLVPIGARRRVSSALRKTNLLEPVRAARRVYRVARRQQSS